MMNRFYRNYGNYYPQQNENLNYIKDYGMMPLAVNIRNLAKNNENFRTVLWTGTQFQVTLMNILPNESIGIEIHPNVDQFIQIVQGNGMVKMGESHNNLDFSKKVSEDISIIIPAGKWHYFQFMHHHNIKKKQFKLQKQRQKNNFIKYKKSLKLRMYFQ